DLELAVLDVQAPDDRHEWDQQAADHRNQREEVPEPDLRNEIAHDGSPEPLPRLCEPPLNNVWNGPHRLVSSFAPRLALTDFFRPWESRFPPSPPRPARCRTSSAASK